ncbi:unnamed protein product, partial [Gongylonema pulchrum]|uniref:FAD assembly factor SdhE n=1 Tax=Gongylonema pulchrum TaxID=637853 RepID=A0A183D9C5_9BILA
MSVEFRGRFLRDTKEVFGIDIAASFDELSSYLSPNLNPNELATLYEHVDDVDLVVGVLAERPTRGSLV